MKNIFATTRINTFYFRYILSTDGCSYEGKISTNNFGLKIISEASLSKQNNYESANFNSSEIPLISWNIVCHNGYFQ